MILEQKYKNKLEKQIEPNKYWREICNTYNVDFHELDWKSLAEEEKDYSKQEFKAYVFEKIKSLSKIDKMQMFALEREKTSNQELNYITQEKEQKELLEQQEKTEKEYQNILEDIKTTTTPNISKITWKLREFIKLVLSNKTDKHTIIIVGRAGCGKTYTIKSVLKEFFSVEELTKVIKNGHISPLAYYNMIYDNPKGIFFFDDMGGIYKNETGISLIKQTTETEKKRLVCYSSTTGKLEHRNTQFFFEGNQILCMNAYPKSKDFIPILSRIRPLVFNPTYKEIMLMMYEIIKEKYMNIPLKQKLEIVGFIERNTSPATENFDLRLLGDFIDLYRFCNGMNDKFEEMSKSLIETDVIKEKILELSKTTMPIEKQYQEIKQHISRSTFYSIRAELRLVRNYGL